MLLGMRPLISAMNNAAAMKELLRLGARADILCGQESFLVKYCRDAYTDADVLRLLLQNGACVNAPDARRRTPLMHSIDNQASSEVIQVLIEEGADVFAVDAAGKSVFDRCQERGKWEPCLKEYAWVMAVWPALLSLASDGIHSLVILRCR